jgi:hypothetical protein
MSNLFGTDPSDDIPGHEANAIEDIEIEEPERGAYST